MVNSNPTSSKDFRRYLRRESTSCERRLWHYLKAKQIEGLKFRRQHGYGPYVMDFYCPQLNWCIEVDGDIHDMPEIQSKDMERTAYLNHYGITVTRVRNEDIETDIADVVRHINTLAQEMLANINDQKAQLLENDRQTI